TEAGLRVRRLLAKRHHHRLTQEESAWLTAFEDTHAAPEEWSEQRQYGNAYASDLGVNMGGLSVIGTDFVEELRAGNIHIAGGWASRVMGVMNPTGWPRGYVAELH